MPFAAFLAMPPGYNIHWIVSPTQELSLVGGTSIYGPGTMCYGQVLKIWVY